MLGRKTTDVGIDLMTGRKLSDIKSNKPRKNSKIQRAAGLVLVYLVFGGDDDEFPLVGECLSEFAVDVVLVGFQGTLSAPPTSTGSRPTPTTLQ